MFWPAKATPLRLKLSWITINNGAKKRGGPAFLATPCGVQKMPAVASLRSVGLIDNQVFSRRNGTGLVGGLSRFRAYSCPE